MKNRRNILTNSLLKSSALVKITGAVIGVLSSIIDGIIINRFLGNAAMSAYGLATPTMFLYVAFGGMLATGIQSVVGNAIGKGDKEVINRTYTSTIIFSIILSTIIGLLFFIFSKQIAAFLGAKGEASSLLEETSNYIKGYAICAPLAILQYVLIVYVTLDGKGGLVTIGAIFLFVIDILGDILNVFVFKQGLFGMALASSISIIVCVLVLCIYFFKKDKLFKFQGLKVNFKTIGKSSIGGLSFLFKQLGNIFRSMLLNQIIVGIISVSALSTLSVVSTMRTLTFSTIGGIGESAFMIASIFYTEKDKKGLSNLLYASRKQTFILGSSLTVLFIALSGPIACLFISDLPFTTSWTSLAAIALMLFFLSIIPYSLQYILRNYLLAIKKNGQVYIFTILNELIFPVLFALVLGSLFGFYGFMASFVVSEIFTVIVMAVISLCLKKRNVSFRDAILNIPEDFEKEKEIHIEFNSIEEVMDFSRKTYDFILENTQDDRKAVFISIAIEELGKNIIEHGIKKQGNMGYMRVIIQKDNIVIRLRDNCGSFNPKEWIKNTENDYCNADHIGLKLTIGLCDNVEYINTLKLNNITMTMKRGELCKE